MENIVHNYVTRIAGTNGVMHTNLFAACYHLEGLGFTREHAESALRYVSTRHAWRTVLTSSAGKRIVIERKV